MVLGVEEAATVTRARKGKKNNLRPADGQTDRPTGANLRTFNIIPPLGGEKGGKEGGGGHGQEKRVSDISCDGRRCGGQFLSEDYPEQKTTEQKEHWAEFVIISFVVVAVSSSA